MRVLPCALTHTCATAAKGTAVTCISRPFLLVVMAQLLFGFFVLFHLFLSAVPSVLYPPGPATGLDAWSICQVTHFTLPHPYQVSTSSDLVITLMAVQRLEQTESRVGIAPFFPRPPFRLVVDTRLRGNTVSSCDILASCLRGKFSVS